MHQNEHCSIALIAMKLSTPFDYVNNYILLDRLYRNYGTSDTSLKWVGSYLSGRMQCIVLNGAYSKKETLDHGVPQGSVLGARLYTLYTRPLSYIFRNYCVLYQTYADYTQLYVQLERENTSIMKMDIKTMVCITLC